jgi:hypothetical protein
MGFDSRVVARAENQQPISPRDVNLPLPKSSFGGKLGQELETLRLAINSLRPIPTPGAIVTRTSGGTSIQPSRRKSSTASFAELRRCLVKREGWAAIEGEDDNGDIIIAIKPASLLMVHGYSELTPYEYAGNSLTAEREPDTATWPLEEALWMKLRGHDFPGEPNEYWREVVWPPYINLADSVEDGCRIKSNTSPAAYFVAASGNLSSPGALIDSVTLDYYDSGSPVGESIEPEWTDANFDARRWTPWSLISNRLVLDGDGLHVPNE